MRAEVLVTGIVQGVGFRPFIYRAAVRARLVGYVRNRGDAGVEIVVEGEASSIEGFLSAIRLDKPQLALINDVKVRYLDAVDEFSEFSIRESSSERRQQGSVIPPDVAICGQCLAETEDPSNRRHDYFFTSCTECGPRYTTILDLPYDRPNTTMQDFCMCDECRSEYANPADRRFHAQTVACPKCGPKAYLLEKDGSRVECDDPIRLAGRLVEEGSIVAVEGNGGFHVATSTLRSEPIARLRGVKHRSQKPFAIMSPCIDRIMRFANLTGDEEKLLTSPIRPIVLLNKSEDYFLSDLVAPALHNVGVMLPYTGLHYILFDNVREPAFVMTSANPPGEPIVIGEERAVKELGGKVVDYLLVHNRRIAQRCDDSVVRLSKGGTQSIIRRSRGYAPAPIPLSREAAVCTIAFGGEYNVTSCIVLKNKAFISQHIGDVEKYETYLFHKEAAMNIINLTNAKIELVACDLHPRFATTALAKEFAAELGVSLVQVQHHQAHVEALMAERGIPEMIGISCDGAGYGTDGSIWGGEVLYCPAYGTSFKRIGHLQGHPMPGGDLAAIHPLRMLGGLLHEYPDVAEKLLTSRSSRLPHGRVEVDVTMKQIISGKSVLTSSCGRVLDGVSSLLDICSERTYEGEPAMKLESVALRGEDKLRLQPQILSGNVVRTDNLVLALLDSFRVETISDLASSTEAYLARSLAEVAVEEARALDVKDIGFTGGVAYNNHISRLIEEIVSSHGYRFHDHNSVPPGDGGLSLGQAVAAGYS